MEDDLQLSVRSLEPCYVHSTGVALHVFFVFRFSCLNKLDVMNHKRAYISYQVVFFTMILIGNCKCHFFSVKSVI